jgi:hypothetical protein
LTAYLGPHKITPAGWTACGAPRYVLADVTPATADSSAEFAAHAPGWDTRLKTPGGWFITSGYTQAWKNSATPKMPGLVSGFSPDGVRRWFYPSYFHTHGSLGAPSARRGLFIGDWYYGGTATIDGVGEIFHVGGNLGQHYLFTVDGLYISELFRDARSGPLIPAVLERGMSLDDTTNGTEGWASGFFRHPGNGRYYVLSCVQHATAPVIGEVQGLRTVRRLAGGTLAITEAQLAAARVFADSATGSASAAFLPVARLKSAPTVDGRLDDWDLGVGVRVGGVGEERNGRMALAVHGDRLFLAGDVRDPFPLRNRGVDPLVLFKTGTCVDLMLGTDSAAPKERTRAAAGDLRLLCSVQDDKPVVVLYRPVAPGAPAGEATTFSSPNQTTRFDSVKMLTDAKVAFVRRQDGFALECSVPLAILNWNPVPGSTWRGDVGVIFADDVGQKNILRRYWANRNTNLTADTAMESALTPAEWGELRVE